MWSASHAASRQLDVGPSEQSKGHDRRSYTTLRDTIAKTANET